MLHPVYLNLYIFLGKVLKHTHIHLKEYSSSVVTHLQLGV